MEDIFGTCPDCGQTIKISLEHLLSLLGASAVLIQTANDLHDLYVKLYKENEEEVAEELVNAGKAETKTEARKKIQQAREAAECGFTTWECPNDTCTVHQLTLLEFEEWE